jgi:hypothetical protein
MLQFLSGNLGVNLGSGDFRMHEYLAYAFYRHTLDQRKRSERVAEIMEDQMLLNTSKKKKFGKCPAVGYISVNGKIAVDNLFAI